MPEQKKDPKKTLIGAAPIIFLIVVAIALSLSSLFSTSAPTERVPYSELLNALRSDRIQRVEISNNDIIAELKPAEPVANNDTKAAKPARIVTERLPRMDESKFVEELSQRKVEFSGDIEEGSWFTGMFYAWLIPFGLIFVVYFFVMRRMQGGKGGPLSFGKNRAKLYDANQEKKVTFSDVAGIDEAVAEMYEVVDFLKNPGKYRAIGAKIPKGVLLLGPPGTGKTLMARAVAGEASVPFFNMSGSEFVEMFVGVGAARVRDLFEQAKLRSPCIIFIDEIDAIGKSRGGAQAMSMHDEREQTLNQLLAEMDGFDDTQGVVIIAATNRPEVLDPALVRAGRFDRQVVVDRPSWDGRLAILKIHTRGLKLKDVDLEVVARRTPGMVGADLAKTANEAALAAARRDSEIVEQRDFEEAVDRIQLGLKKRGRAMNQEETRRVAYHESGHALVAMSVENADPVHRVTIIPRTIGALGATLQLPTEDRYLMLRKELRDRICVMLGGRAAEELALDDVSTGAQNDLERATETARQMVCRFGMSDKLGIATFGRPMGARFLESPVAFGDERNFSEETARSIDHEVRTILEVEHKRALRILSEKRHLLEAITEQLLVDETLERGDLEELMKQVAPARLPKVGT